MSTRYADFVCSAAVMGDDNRVSFTQYLRGSATLACPAKLWHDCGTVVVQPCSVPDVR
jgi:hypothetical protein